MRGLAPPLIAASLPFRPIRIFLPLGSHYMFFLRSCLASLIQLLYDPFRPY
jgi:hypothetical protein